MNKTTSLLLSGLMTTAFSASGAIVAGWDTWVASSGTTYPAPITNGVTAEAVGTSTPDGAGWGTWNEEGRSGDGTWGTQALSPLPSTSTADATDSTGLRNSTNSGELTITITNSSGSALDLTSFHFDGIARFTKSPDQWALSILSGAVTTGPIASGTVENVSSFAARTGEGYDIDLSTLADTTFENGESVIFELAFTGGADPDSGGHNTMIDNMAIVAVPEPSIFALISGLGVLGLVLYRRSRD